MEAATSTSYLLGLPKETIVFVCCFLPVPNFISIHNTCKFLQALTNIQVTPFINKQYWKHILHVACKQINYSLIENYQYVCNDMNWQQIYQEFKLKYKKPIHSYYVSFQAFQGLSNQESQPVSEDTDKDLNYDPDSMHNYYWMKVLQFTAVKYDCPQILRILTLDENFLAIIHDKQCIFSESKTFGRPAYTYRSRLEMNIPEFEMFRSWCMLEIALYFDSKGVIDYLLSSTTDADMCGNSDHDNMINMITCHDIGFACKHLKRIGCEFESSLQFHDTSIKNEKMLSSMIKDLNCKSYNYHNCRHSQYSLLTRMIECGMYEYGLQVLNHSKCDTNISIKDKHPHNDNLLHIACNAFKIDIIEKQNWKYYNVVPMGIVFKFIKTLVDKLDSVGCSNIVTETNNNHQIPLDCFMNRLVKNYNAVPLTETHKGKSNQGTDYDNKTMACIDEIIIIRDDYIDGVVDCVKFLMNKSKLVLKLRKLLFKAVEIKYSPLAYKLVRLLLSHGNSGNYNVSSIHDRCQFELNYNHNHSYNSNYNYNKRTRLILKPTIKNILNTQDKMGTNLFTMACRRHHLRLIIFIYDQLTNCMVTNCNYNDDYTISSSMQDRSNIQYLQNRTRSISSGADDDIVIVNQDTYPAVVSKYLNAKNTNYHSSYYHTTPYIQACMNANQWDSKDAIETIKTLVNRCKDFVDITIGTPVRFHYLHSHGQGIGLQRGSSYYKDLYDNRRVMHLWDQEKQQFYCWLRICEDERRRELCLANRNIWDWREMLRDSVMCEKRINAFLLIDDVDLDPCSVGKIYPIYKGHRFDAYPLLYD